MDKKYKEPTECELRQFKIDIQMIQNPNRRHDKQKKTMARLKSFAGRYPDFLLWYAEENKLKVKI